MPKYTCMTCTDRKLGCHATCSTYIAECGIQDELRAKREQDRIAERQSFDRGARIGKELRRRGIR